MTDKIILVTPPDDILLQGIRVLLVDLDENQRSIVSNALLMTNMSHNIVNYVWQIGNDKNWLLDKTSKCDIIIFNANSHESDLITGWISAQPQSYYFGILKDLHLVNDRAIYTTEDIIFLLEKVSKQHEQI